MRANGDDTAAMFAIKKSQKSKLTTLQPVSTNNLRGVVGGANSVFVKPTKTVGGLAETSGGQGVET